MLGMYGLAAKPEQRTTNRLRKFSPVLVSSVHVVLLFVEAHRGHARIELRVLSDVPFFVDEIEIASQLLVTRIKL